MSDFHNNIEWQKNHLEMKLSYNLDYDAKSFWIIPETSVELRGLPFYVQEVGYTIAHEKYYVHRENLPSYMIAFILSGGIMFEYDGAKTKTASGSCIWFDCKKPHSFYIAKGEHLLETYYVHIYGKGAEKYHQYFRTLAPNGSVDTSNSTTVLFYLKKLIDLYRSESRSIMTDLTASTYIANLCQALLECAHANAKNETPEYIYQIKKYIEDNFSQKITLDNLSQKHFMSPAYLQKQFKKHVGVSPNDYLTRIRIENSKKLLRVTNYSINKISFDTGFNNDSYFINIFKKSEGITPLEYRKLWGPN